MHINQYVPGEPPYGGGYPGTPPPMGYGTETYSEFLPAPAPAKSANPLANLKFQDIKTWIDRMGGIDGILNTINKMQRVMQTIQQFAPMVRMLLPKADSASADDDDDDEYYRRRRRRAKRRKYRRTAARSRGYGSGRRRRRKSATKRYRRYGRY